MRFIETLGQLGNLLGVLDELARGTRQVALLVVDHHVREIGILDRVPCRRLQRDVVVGQ